MIPICDSIPSRTAPRITVGLVALNLLVLLGLVVLPDARASQLIVTYGLVPAQISWDTVLTSLLLHASALQALSNALALWICGPAVEDRLGHGRFLALVMACALGGTLIEARAAATATLPIVGLTGGVAGVLAASVGLFPSNKIVLVVPGRMGVDVAEAPALFVPAFWLVAQAGAAAWGGFTPVHASVVTPLVGAAGGLVLGRVLCQPARLRVDWWGA